MGYILSSIFYSYIVEGKTLKGSKIGYSCMDSMIFLMFLYHFGMFLFRKIERNESSSFFEPILEEYIIFQRKKEKLIYLVVVQKVLYEFNDCWGRIFNEKIWALIWEMFILEIEKMEQFSIQNHVFFRLLFKKTIENELN